MANARRPRRGLALNNANFHILDTNMLVSPTQNAGIGGIAQRQPPTPDFCIAVEYRLKSYTWLLNAAAFWVQQVSMNVDVFPRSLTLGEPWTNWNQKPIFHQKTGWRRVKFASPNVKTRRQAPNATYIPLEIWFAFATQHEEIYTKKKKCTWPTQETCVT